MMLWEVLCKVTLLTFALVVLNSYAVAGDRPKIYPSSKYPDFPFSEAVAYEGVLYLSGDVGTDELECIAALR